MGYPYDQIEKEISKCNAKIVNQEIYQSKNNWFCNEVWEIEKYESRKFLNFLNDPEFGTDGKLWAISITSKIPETRSEAEKEKLIVINKDLLINLRKEMKSWL